MTFTESSELPAEDHDYVLRTSVINNTTVGDRNPDEYVVYKLTPLKLFDGYLMKRGDKMRSMWYSYYLLLTHDAIHCFLVDKEAKQAISVENDAEKSASMTSDNKTVSLKTSASYSIPLDSIIKPVAFSVLGNTCLQIVTEEKIFYFRCITKDECNVWLSVINASRIRCWWWGGNRAPIQNGLFRFKSVSPSGEEHCVVRSFEEISHFAEKMNQNYSIPKLDVDVNDKDRLNRMLIDIVDYFNNLLAKRETNSKTVEFISEESALFFPPKNRDSNLNSTEDVDISSSTIIEGITEKVVFMALSNDTVPVKNQTLSVIGFDEGPEYFAPVTGRKIIIATEHEETNVLHVYGSKGKLIGSKILPGKLRAVRFCNDDTFFVTVSLIPLNPYDDVCPFMSLTPLEDLNGIKTQRVIANLCVQLWAVYGMSYVPNGAIVPGTIRLYPIQTIMTQEMIFPKSFDPMVLNNFCDLTLRSNKLTPWLALAMSNRTVAVWNAQRRSMANYIDLDSMTSSKSATVVNERFNPMWLCSNGGQSKPPTFIDVGPSVEFHPDVSCNIIIVGVPKQTVIFWDYEKSQVVWKIDCDIRGLAWRMKEKALADIVLVNSLQNPKIRIYDAKTRKRTKRLNINEPGIWDDVDSEGLAQSWRNRARPEIIMHSTRDQMIVVTCHGKVFIWNFDETHEETMINSCAGLLNEIVRVDALENYGISPLVQQSGVKRRVRSNKGPSVGSSLGHQKSMPKPDDDFVKGLLDPFAEQAVAQEVKFASLPNIDEATKRVSAMESKSFPENVSGIISLNILSVSHAGYSREGNFIWTWSPSEGYYGLWTLAGKLVGEAIIAQNDVESHQNYPPTLVESGDDIYIVAICKNLVVKRALITPEGQIVTNLQQAANNSFNHLKKLTNTFIPLGKGQTTGSSGSVRSRRKPVIVHHVDEHAMMTTTIDVLDYVICRLRTCKATLTLAETQYQLVVAVMEENFGLLKQVFDKNPGLDPNFESLLSQQTPLTTACLTGNYKIAQFLIEKGAKINLHGRASNILPIHAACVSGNPKLVSLLLEHPQCQINILWNLRPFEAAFLRLNYLVEDPPSFVHCLHLAAFHGFDSVVEILTQHGCNPNILDSNHRSPLHFACATFRYHRSVKTVEYLIVKGADVNLISSSRSTPLHEAVFAERCADLVFLLVRAGAMADSTRDIYGDTPVDIYPEVFTDRRVQTFLRPDTIEFLKYEI